SITAKQVLDHEFGLRYRYASVPDAWKRYEPITILGTTPQVELNHALEQLDTLRAKRSGLYLRLEITGAKLPRSGVTYAVYANRAAAEKKVGPNDPSYIGIITSLGGLVQTSSIVEVATLEALVPANPQSQLYIADRRAGAGSKPELLAAAEVSITTLRQL